MDSLSDRSGQDTILLYLLIVRNNKILNIFDFQDLPIIKSGKKNNNFLVGIRYLLSEIKLRNLKLSFKMKVSGKYMYSNGNIS